MLPDLIGDGDAFIAAEILGDDGVGSRLCGFKKHVAVLIVGEERIAVDAVIHSLANRLRPAVLPSNILLGKGAVKHQSGGVIEGIHGHKADRFRKVNLGKQLTAAEGVGMDCRDRFGKEHGLERGATVEGIALNDLKPCRQGHAHHAAAIGKGIAGDGFERGGQDRPFKARTAAEGRHADGGHGIGKGQGEQGGAIAEGLLTDGDEPLGQYDVHNVLHPAEGTAGNRHGIRTQRNGGCGRGRSLVAVKDAAGIHGGVLRQGKIPTGGFKSRAVYLGHAVGN